ncbi:GTPase-associated system all-helical protein GASH [Dickeya dadantii]|uniref:GTPase-associated system all-helical protein GASH n=1 Tax=Dickeya dadantii TaxID=204038 RepID=UPI001C0B3394|nr:GTPase-associated system all-helical protein GASH [Dickeya dadantii]QWT40906.1 hypothetical protein KNV89_21790 [Dickeya dadantii]
MANFTFADRYREAGLSPTSQTIISRQEPVNRIVANISDSQILDLLAVYYGSSQVNLDWFRDEFVQEDASFSLLNNQRETCVLAALILGHLVHDENAVTILAVSVGRVKGLRIPSQCAWLMSDAEETLTRLSIANREPEKIATKISTTVTSKLGEQITALGNTTDWATLITILGQIRIEAQNSVKNTATQVTNALNVFDRQTKQMREESQMLWWLIGGHSRTFERCFNTFTPQQAALVGAVDLGILTTHSEFGPIAIPAMLERVIASAKKTKTKQSLELAAVVDSFSIEDLESLIIPTQLPARLAPVTTAIELARTMGTGSWHSRFQTKTDLDCSIQLEPVLLAEQLYRELLLGRLL